ncbi:hypothetical protein SS50377_22999 [Spironucleus salmonicida]|uniref:Uncharacterized protein n=1 Tax=Spironucleus salmonicida TaxID=348837 RepID=V6LV47_9EUKA|nr:hypothetical protein SS50377_22999 [Spironucleus salmonicida]|eukprot:EST47581.1 Hypothetical protein SS50377_12272 [Spironucleus salmonicida]
MQLPILLPMRYIQKPTQYGSPLYQYFDGNVRHTKYTCPISSLNQHPSSPSLLPTNFFLQHWNDPLISEYSGLKPMKKRKIQISSNLNMEELRNIQIRREQFSESTVVANQCMIDWVKGNGSIPTKQNTDDKLPDWVLRQKVGQRRRKLCLDEVAK